MIGSLHLVAARILVETGEVTLAREHLAAGHLHVGDNGLIETHLFGLEAATLLAEEADGINAALCETRHRLVRGLRYSVRADLLTVTLQLRHGRISDAVSDFRAMFSQRDDTWLHLATGLIIPKFLATEIEQMAAWIALCEGDVEGALAQTARLLPAAEREGRFRDHLALLMLGASCAVAKGNLGEARRSFERALRLANEGGFHRTIVDHGWALTPLLVEYGSDAVGPAPNRVLIQALQARYGIALEEGNDNSIESLTTREQEVLVLLDTGLKSQAIADHIGLGLSTTKWHIQNIYNKLGVRNRSGALSRARRLALL
jgi:LuxR family maltose regulon positive regulatory protein